MRFNRIWTFMLMILLTLPPFPLMAQAPPLDEMDHAVREGEVRQFLEGYTIQYTKMEIDKFMTFFSQRAVENRMLPYADIRELYQGTFDNSDSLQYQLEILSIQTYGKSAFVSGRYRVVQALKGEKIELVFQGNIQWYIVREETSLKIREINYGRHVTQLPNDATTQSLKDSGTNNE
jgi:hypothetical protein